MSSLSRFKIGLLLWLIVTVCLGMVIATGVQSFGPGMQLSGMMDAPGTASGGASPRPQAAAGNPNPSRTPIGSTGGSGPSGPGFDFNFKNFAAMPIHWTAGIPIRDLNELANPEPLLNHPVSFPTRTDRLTMVDGRGKAAVVKTVGDYLRFKSQGWRAKAASDGTLEIFAKAQLYPLIYLRRAQGARQSFVSDFDITDHPLTNLPPTLGPVLSAEQAAAVAKRAPGTAAADWKAIFPSTRVTTIDKNTIRISDRSAAGAAEVRLTVLAWGDFNHDGLEDVLVSAITFDRGGTAHHYALAVLTRTTKAGPLTMVEYQQ